MPDPTCKLTVSNVNAASLFDLLVRIAASPVYIGHTNRVTCYACTITEEDLSAITLKFGNIKVDRL